MKMKFRTTALLSALFLCETFTVTFARNFFLAAPKILRLNAEETVAIVMEDSSGALVNVSVQDYPQKLKTIISRTVELDFESKIIKIQLHAEDFPPAFFETPDQPKYVSLTVSFQEISREFSKEFSKEIVIPVTTQSGYMFIQTDKPIYTPRQNVLFRIIPVTEEIRQSKEPFQLIIKNPKNVTVEKKNFNEKHRKLSKAFTSHVYALSSNPLLGEWSAIVRYGHNMEQECIIHFTVKEYVLPTFSVELVTPDVILPNQDTFHIAINAKSVYRKDFQGIVNFRLGVRKPDSLTPHIFQEVTGRELCTGCDSFDTAHYNLSVRTADIKKLQTIGWFPQIDGSYLFVEATVVDAATGNTKTVTDVTGRFATTPFVISFDRCIKNFKPGVISYIQADITYVRGNPANGIRTKISAVANDGKDVHIIEGIAISNEEGKVSFEIRPEIQHTSITITLETIDERYEGGQARGTFVQESFKSANNACLSISPFPMPHRLRLGNTLKCRVHFQPLQMYGIYYMVIAKGKIIDIDKVLGSSLGSTTVGFVISYDMIPNFRVLIFTHQRNELLVDSLKFDVESVCDRHVQVIIRANLDDSLPGYSGKISIDGKEGITVGLSAMDGAAYELSKRDRLTKAKILNTLGSHDLGYGPGGGSTVESVLENAGIIMGTNYYTPRIPDSWHTFGRRRRSVPDEFEISPEMQENLEKYKSTRFDLRETWLWEDIVIGPDRSAEFEVSLPSSMTTWIVQAVYLTPENGMCVAEPQEMKIYREMFIHLNLPYSVRRNEHVEIQATVFNYGSNEKHAYVFMDNTDDLCTESTPKEKSDNVTILVEPMSAATVTFFAVPTKVKDYPIKVYAITAESTDVIERWLHVVPEGITKEIDIPFKLDPTNMERRRNLNRSNEFYTENIDPIQNLQTIVLKFPIPEGFVPGSVSCYITAMRNTLEHSVSTSIKNPENFIRQPLGSGELNMMILAPTVYALNYLRVIGKLTATTEVTGGNFIRKGYEDELKYRKDDGSYSNGSTTGSSTWLTAFVTRVFCQSNKFVSIDQNVIRSGVKWLIENQRADGFYIEKTALQNKDTLGGVEDQVSLTAFVLITLSECGSDEQNLMLAKQRAIVYLESQVDEVKESLPAALVAYALTLGNSHKKEDAISKLLALAKYDEDNNRLYWTTSQNAQDVEIAGYALLTLLLSTDMDRSNSIVNWLNSKQLQSGDFKSTQDTVVALEALSKYLEAAKSTVNLVSNITSNIDKNFHKVLVINDDNALVQQNVKFDKVGDSIFIRTSGQGQGTLTVKLRYNVIEPDEDTCKFEVKVNVTEVKDFVPVAHDQRNKRETADEEKQSALNIAICVRYLGKDDAGMSVVNVGTFSGFKPYIRDLKMLQDDNNHLIKKYENSSRGVVFYLEKVPTKESYCFNYHVLKKFYIGNTQMSIIRVYERNNPDESCTKFYNPKNENPMLQTICENGKDCRCAKGIKGCVLEHNSQLVAEPIKEYYSSGDEVTFSCPLGQKLSDDVQKVKCMGERWTDPIPHCVVDE